MSRPCGEPAQWRVMWPGKPPIAMCDDHATGASAISAAMGFYLHMEPITEGSCTAQTEEK